MKIIGTIHYKNENDDYLCSNYFKANPNKMSNLISSVNCEMCLKMIKENDFTVNEMAISQTNLTELIY